MMLSGCDSRDNVSSCSTCVTSELHSVHYIVVRFSIISISCVVYVCTCPYLACEHGECSSVILEPVIGHRNHGQCRNESQIV